MRAVLGLVLWAVVILGALPTAGQRELASRLGWWHPRLMGIVSSFVEGLCGWQLLRDVLFRSELGVLSSGAALPLGVLGFFMLAEGLVRLGVTLKLPGSALPSLPVSLAFRAVLAFARSRDR